MRASLTAEGPTPDRRKLPRRLDSGKSRKLFESKLSGVKTNWHRTISSRRAADHRLALAIGEEPADALELELVLAARRVRDGEAVDEEEMVPAEALRTSLRELVVDGDGGRLGEASATATVPWCAGQRQLGEWRMGIGTGRDRGGRVEWRKRL